MFSFGRPGFPVALLLLVCKSHGSAAFVPTGPRPLITPRIVGGKSSFLPPRADCRTHVKALVACRGGAGGVHTCMQLAGDLWQSYLGALDAAPLLTKSITAGLIFPAADLVAQTLDKIEEGDGEGGCLDVDLIRSLRWTVFGFFVQAPWNHFFYLLLDGALPPTPEAFSTTTGVKVLLDQFVQAPIFTVVIFWALGALEGKSLESIKQKLDEEYVSTMKVNWAVFVPAAVVNLAFCPPQLRVLFLNVVFFGYSIFLSLVVNKRSS